MTAWEFYIEQHTPKLVVAPPIKRGASETYHGPSKRTKAKRAAKRARRS